MIDKSSDSSLMTAVTGSLICTEFLLILVTLPSQEISIKIRKKVKYLDMPGIPTLRQSRLIKLTLDDKRKNDGTNQFNKKGES